MGPVSVRHVVVLGALLACCACATRRPSTWSPSVEFVEPQPELGPVKPARLREHQQPELHLALALSGGGHRAANFALGVMLGLEETPSPAVAGRDLLDEVDLISSVSGGGFGAAAYVGSLRDARLGGRSAADYSLHGVVAGQELKADQLVRRHLERGYTSGILAAPLRNTRLMFDPDLNRTDSFEERVDDELLGSEWRRRDGDPAQREGLGPNASLRLSDVFVPTWSERPVLVPHWVTNATAYENGAIVPLLPGTLMQYLVSGYTHRLEHSRFTRPFTSEGVGDDGFTDAERAYAEWVFTLPLAIGVTASANFPGVLPPSNLESRMDPLNDDLLLVDGGVADNLGVLTAVRMLEQMPAGERRVLVVVCADAGALGPFSTVNNTDVFTVAADLLGSTFLGSFHGRAQELVRARCAQSDIEVLFLSFEDLMEPDDLNGMTALPKTVGKWLGLDAVSRDRVIAESAGPLRLPGPQRPRPRDPKRPARNLRPFELLRAVPTDFQCTNEEQRLLVSAGRYVVAKKVPELLVALGMATSADGAAGGDGVGAVESVGAAEGGEAAGGGEAAPRL